MLARSARCRNSLRDFGARDDATCDSAKRIPRIVDMLHPIRVTQFRSRGVQPLKILAQEGTNNEHIAAPVEIKIYRKPAPGRCLVIVTGCLCVLRPWAMTRKGCIPRGGEDCKATLSNAEAKCSVRSVLVDSSRKKVRSEGLRS